MTLGEKVNFTVRAEESGDEAAIRKVLLAAFPSADEADLVDALRENKSVWEPGTSFVAVSDTGEIIGQALLTRCWIDSVPALALAPCAVFPKYQGQGVGSAVIEAALESARRIAQTGNSPQCAIVLGHAEYYPRFGFEPARSFGIRAPFEVPSEAFMALNLNPEFELPSGTVIYPAEFGIEIDDEDI